MTGNVQGPGNQQPVDYSGSSVGKGAESARVGSGLISGSAKLQMMQADKAVTHSQLAHRPTLIKPEAMSTTAQVAASQSANEDLTGIGKATKLAADNVGSTMMRVQLGMQKTPEDQQWLQRNAATLRGSSEYLKSLQTGENKQLLLGGQGLTDEQIEDLLLSQSDRAAFTNKLKAKYGDAYNQKRADLIAMGYDDHQADMILSLGDDNLMRNELRQAELKKIFKHSPEGQRLAELGLNEKQIKQLLALINKGPMPEGSLINNEYLQKLMKKMGFSKKEACILLATGSPEKLKEQLLLMKQQKANPQMAEQMQAMATAANEVASVPKRTILPEHLKQLADIFMVLELIHQMSVEQRRYAREARAMEYDAAKAEVLKQAEHIRKAAIFTLVADSVSATATIAGGAASMKSGMKSTKAKTPSSQNNKTQADGVDDVEVSSSSGKKSHRVRKGSKASRQRDLDKGAADTQHHKNSRKQAKDIEDSAAKADQRKAEQDFEAQTQNAAQRKKNKEVVVDDQNQDMANKQQARKSSDKRMENSNEMMTNSNSGMMSMQLSGALGTMLAAPFKFLASEEQAKQKESEAHQKTHENAAQSWSEWMQLQQDQVKNCQSKIEEISRIHYDTLKSLSRG